MEIQIFRGGGGGGGGGIGVKTEIVLHDRSKQVKQGILWSPE